MTTSTSSHKSKNPLRGSVEIIPDRLYYCALKTPPSTSHKMLLRNRQNNNNINNNNKKVPNILFTIDEELVYWSFFLDFGPLNLAQLYRFTCRLNQLLADHPNATILFYSSIDNAKRANAIYLICAWQVLELKRNPMQAFYGFRSCYNNNINGMVDDPSPNNNGSPTFKEEDENDHKKMKTRSSSSSSNSTLKSCSKPPPLPLSSIGADTIAPLPTFHDASPYTCTYDLNIYHCLQSIVKARQYHFMDWENFNVEEYEHYEQVKNGDLNWIVQDRIIAFAGPSYQNTVTSEEHGTLAPSDYIPYFQKHNVSLVVQLNQKNYDEQEFVKVGIQHLDQFYLDGSCPPMNVLQRVLQAFEQVPSNKAFAVHCRAGLGRTGTCIGAYLMKHYQMTAPEVIAWMRICRPGSVIGPQQQHLHDLQPIMWQEGEMERSLLNTTTTTPISRLSAGTTTTTSSSSTKTNKKKKKIVSATSSAPDKNNSPTSVKDSVMGRPGQADGLLAAKRQRPSVSTPSTTTITTTTLSVVVSTPESNKKKTKAVTKPTPIAPDASSKPRATSSSSGWS